MSQGTASPDQSVGVCQGRVTLGRVGDLSARQQQ